MAVAVVIVIVIVNIVVIIVKSSFGDRISKTFRSLPIKKLLVKTRGLLYFQTLSLPIISLPIPVQ